jgi:methionyl-tRNA formyltransferase
MKLDMAFSPYLFGSVKDIILKGVPVASRVSGKNDRQLLLEGIAITTLRLVMMGAGTFAEPTLEALLAGPDPVVGVFTQPDKETGPKRGSTRQVGRGIKEIAREKSIAVFQPADVNAPEGVAMLRDQKPDLLVVAAYGQILSKDVLLVPSLGGVNVHASLLPKYRGAAPIAWAIYHGETHSGVTIIRMSASLDAGDMLDQQALEIYPEETAGDLEARLAPLGAKMALDAIARLKSGPISGMKQDKSLVTKAPKLKKEDGLIDWTRSAAQVTRQIRAMQPWPTAYTFLHREGKPPLRMMIALTGKIIGASSGSSPPTPGLLWGGDGSSLWVFTGNSEAIQVLELQLAGKKRMPSIEFLRGHPLQPGDRFGAESS